jgi:hypothetical protein
MMTPHEIDSLASFGAAVVDAAEAAVAQRCRRLLLVDPRFDDWPLEDPRLIEALTAFVKLPERRVVLLGEGFDGVTRSCPRFVAWRQVWSHAIDALRPADDGVHLPTVLLADRSIAVQVFDRVHWLGRVLVGEPGVHRLGGEIDALAQRSEPTFGVRKLGL